MNMSSKEILTILKRLDIEVNNHMSVMDDEMVKKVEQFFKDVKQGAAKSETKQTRAEDKPKNKTTQSNPNRSGRSGQGGGK